VADLAALFLAADALGRNESKRLRTLANRNTQRPGRRYSGGRVALKRAFAANENKPLRAISNRNSNDSRKLATLSESTTSNFLIATKLHVSEEKAKRE
jgi:hypothetical protein